MNALFPGVGTRIGGANQGSSQLVRSCCNYPTSKSPRKLGLWDPKWPPIHGLWMGVIRTTYIPWDGPWAFPNGFLAMSLYPLLPAAPQDDHQHVATVVPRRARCHTNVAAPHPARSSNDVFFVSDLCCRGAAKHTKTCVSLTLTRDFLGAALCWHDILGGDTSTMDLPTNLLVSRSTIQKMRKKRISRSDVLCWRPISGHHCG